MLTISPQPFGDFLAKEFPPQRDWIADGLLPRQGLMILAGGPKVGKSFVAMELCRALALGDNPFGCPHMRVPDPVRVLYIEDEVKERGLQRRGLQVFGDVDRELLNENLFVVSGVPELRLDTPTGWHLLKSAVDQVQPGVLIMDPIGKFIGKMDENSNEQMGEVMSTLAVMQKQHAARELSLVLLHHNKKPDTSYKSKWDPLSPNSMRGASRFYADPDTLIMMARTQELKSRTGERAWKLEAHFETRQSEGLDNMLFRVNMEDDLRVRYMQMVQPPSKLNREIEEEKEETSEGLGFAAAAPSKVKEEKAPW